MSYYTILESIIGEKYSMDNSHLLRYFKNGIDQYTAWPWIAVLIDEGEFDVDLPDGISDLNDIIENGPDGIWELLDGDEQEGALEYAKEKMAEGNEHTLTVMDLNRDKLLPASTWLVHFTNAPESIQHYGFTNGVQQYDLDQMALTMTGKQHNGAGYNFAFRANDRNIDYDKLGKYGNGMVLFQSSGVEAEHYGDEEDQVMFWGPDVDPDSIIAFEEEYGNLKLVSRKTGETIREFEKPSDAIRWTIANLPQYRKHLVKK